jgi:DNA excision repair protein ERCC-4
LLSYDSVTFNSYLETIIASNSTAKGAAKQNQSPWLYLDAANVLFQTAKRRAYTTKARSRGRSVSATPSEIADADDDEWAALDEAESVQAQAEQAARTATTVQRNANGRNRTRSWPEGVEPVLEELPKWGLLSQVLEEIETEISVQPLMDLSE